jgi:hypothetical protein
MGDLIDKSKDFQRLCNIRDELWLLAENAKSMVAEFQTKMMSIHKESTKLEAEFASIREGMSDGRYTLGTEGDIKSDGGLE